MTEMDKSNKSNKTNKSSKALILLWLFLLIGGVLGLPGQSRAWAKTSAAQVQKGFLDLRAWDFAEDGKVALNGEWDFYWGKLIPPQEFQYMRHSLPQAYQVLVPRDWNGFRVDGKTLGGEGYATYYTRIDLGEAPDVLYLKLLDLGTSYSLFINGKKVASNGRPGKSREGTQPMWRPQIVAFATAKELHIVLHIANFHHRKGGLWFPIYLGTGEQIKGERLMNLSLQLFVTGILIVLAVYHLAQFFWRRKDASTLAFAVFAFLLAVRILVTGEKFFQFAFPQSPWELGVKLEYASFYGAIPAFAYFLASLYPVEFHIKLRKAVLVISLAFVVLVLVTPARIYTHSLLWFQLWTVVVGLYATWVVVQAFRHEREQSRLFLGAWIILFVAVVNDILYYRQIVTTPFLPVALFVFLLLMTMILSIRFSRALTQSERLTSDLEMEIQRRRLEIQRREQNVKVDDSKNQAINDLESFSESFWQIKDLDELMRTLFQFAEKRYQAEASWLWLIDRKTEELYTGRFAGGRGFSRESKQLIQNLRVPLNENGGTTWRTFQKKRVVYLPRIRHSRLNRVDRVMAESIGLKSLLQVPVLNENRVVGIVNVVSLGRRMELDREELRFLRRLGMRLGEMLAV